MRLSKADADTAATVPNHCEGAETEPATALGHLGGTLDNYDPDLQLGTPRIGA